MKSGMNMSEIARARALKDDGLSLAEISQKLQVGEKCIKGFLPKKKRKARKKKAE